MRVILPFVFLMILVGWNLPAKADYVAGLEAFNSGEYKKALAEWQKLAEGGDAKAQHGARAKFDAGPGGDVLTEVVKSHTKEQRVQQLRPAVQRGYQGSGHRNHTRQGSSREQLNQVRR